MTDSQKGPSDYKKKWCFILCTVSNLFCKQEEQSCDEKAGNVLLFNVYDIIDLNHMHITSAAFLANGRTAEEVYLCCLCIIYFGMVQDAESCSSWEVGGAEQGGPRAA